MAGISVTFDHQRFADQSHQLTSVEIPAMLRQALRRAAGDIQKRLGVMLASKTDNPIGFSVRGFYADVWRTNAPGMTIGIRQLQANYLQYLFLGGDEQRVLTPTAETKLNKSGNIPRTFIALQEAKGAFWMTSHRRGIRTLFENAATGLRPLAYILPTVHYDQRIDFDQETMLIVSDVLPTYVSQSMIDAFG